MSDQVIIVCDEEGDFLGYIPKELGHIDEGRKHLAITVLLYNNKNEVLLQKRKHQNFNNVWCFTGDTHLLHSDRGDENFEDATRRCLKIEYGIKEKIPLQNLGTFNYFEKDGSRCENEHCAMMVGEYNGQIKMSPDVGYEYRWVNLDDFLSDTSKRPKKYAPWVEGGVKILKKTYLLKQVVFG